MEFFIQKEKIVKVLSLFIILVVLIIIPIKMGEQANKNLPIIGSAEQISYDYCDKTFKKALGAYAIAKLTDKAISTVQKTTFQFSAPVIGITIAPGEWLSAANDAIGRLCTALFTITGIMLFGKLTIGLLSFICIKALLPAAIIFYLLHTFFPKSYAFGKRLSSFFLKLAVTGWLFFPCSALVNTYIETNYLDSEYTNTNDALEKDKKQVEKIDEDIIKGSAEIQSILLGIQQKAFTELRNHNTEKNIAPAGLFSINSDELENITPDDNPDEDYKSFLEGAANGVKKFFSSAAEKVINPIKRKVNELIQLADDTIDRLYYLLIMFILTTIVVPIGMLLFFLGILNSIKADYAILKPSVLKKIPFKRSPSFIKIISFFKKDKNNSHYELSLYDKRTLEDIHNFKYQPVNSDSWYSMAFAVINKPIDYVSETITNMPIFDGILTKSTEGIMSLMQKGAFLTVRKKAIFEQFNAIIHLPVNDVSDIQEIPLELIDNVVDGLRAKYNSLAATEGAVAAIPACEPGGGTAIAVATISADILALTGLCFRAIGEYATYYGFDINKQEEQEYALQVMYYATCVDDIKAKKDILFRLFNIANILSKKLAWKELSKDSLVKIMLTLSKQLGIRLTKAKLIAFLPIAGVAINTGINTNLMNSVCNSAYILYRERHLSRYYNDPKLITLEVNDVETTGNI